MMEMWQILGTIAFSLLCIGLGISNLWWKRYLINNGGRTTATVLRNELRRSGNSGGMWVPVVEYTVDGQTYENYYPRGTALPKFEGGETFEVMYRKNNPNKMMVVGDNFQYVGSIVFMLIGFALFGFGLSELLT